MRKAIVNLVCLFVPSRGLRHELRRRLGSVRENGRSTGRARRLESTIVDSYGYQEVRKFRRDIAKVFSTDRRPGQNFYYDGLFYQSLPELGIAGARPTGDRILMYRLDCMLKPGMEVLDIGCNVGFLDLSIAKYVKHGLGIDNDPKFIKVAEMAKRFMGVKNFDFKRMDFKEFPKGAKYDAVFSFAIHHWIGMPFEEYAGRLYGLLRSGGFLWFSTHDVSRMDLDGDMRDKLRVLKAAGFRLIFAPGFDDDPDRRVYLFSKA